MDVRQAQPPHNAEATRWIAENADTLFAAIRRVVADSLCAFMISGWSSQRSSPIGGERLTAIDRGRAWGGPSCWRQD